MSDLVERLGGAASGLDYIAMLIENGSIDQGSERQSSAVAQAAENVREAAARITELETALAEAEVRVIAEVVKWLRGQAQAGDKALLQAVEGSQLRRDLAAGVVAINRAATALETGEWKK